MKDRMRLLREWYRYLEGQARLAEGRETVRRSTGGGAIRPPRSPGRPRLARNRQAVLRRLLDPEVTLHDAALLLNLSKSTLRRYTDAGRLPSFRSPGGQRRFHLGDLLAFMDRARGRSGAPRL